MSESIDVLLVLNQNSDLSRVARALAPLKGPVVVVTSHALLEEERVLARAAFGTDLRLHRLDEFLDDATMAACDERATGELLGAGVPYERYTRQFEERSERYRNAAVAMRLAERYRPRRVLFQEGLGIHAGAWRERGAMPLQLAWSLGLGQLRHRVRRVFDALRPQTLALLEHGEGRFLFVGRTHRIAFAPGCRLRAVGAFRDGFGRRQSARVSVQRAVREHAGTGLTVCAALHEYRPWLGSLGAPLAVFTDGYHPSNYPRAYLDGIGPCQFVVRDMFDARWFDRFGRPYRRPFGFLASAHMRPLPVAPPVRTVVVALNHAGNWTALISRSDTDLVAMAAADLARALPAVHVVIRPHPTMAEPHHEGVRSLERLRAFVASHGLPNLSFSQGPLDGDLARGDLFVTEYSNVLITAWRMGKPGVAFNPTRRRDLMQDYRALGFPGATSTAELLALVTRAVAVPRELYDDYRAAAARYNRMLDQFLETPEPHSVAATGAGPPAVRTATA